MDKNKRDRITGLVIGLIGMIFLFHFSFSYGGFFTDGSIVAHICIDLITYLNNDILGSTQRNIAYYLFLFIHFSYILFIWFYRACIGHWAFKSVKVFYKKI